MYLPQISYPSLRINSEVYFGLYYITLYINLASVPISTHIQYVTDCKCENMNTQ